MQKMFEAAYPGRDFRATLANDRYRTQSIFNWQHPMLLNQTALLTGADNIASLATEFATTGCARLPGFLAPEILQPLLNWVEMARFEERIETYKEHVFGTTLFVPKTERALFLLHFILNRPALFAAAQQITGCETIRNFTGRIHATGPVTDQHLDWHDDAVQGRTLGICINLSAVSYSGGLLQVRDPQQILRAEMRPAAAGDAFLFKINQGWKHRLTPVTSGRRTVGVGWFRTEPDWRDQALNVARIRQLTAEAEQLTSPIPGGA
jgi:hypothetical protein